MPGKIPAATIHAVLLAEAAARQLPQRYVRDLTVHDLEQLLSSESQDFLWILRESGTNLILLDSKQGRPSSEAGSMIQAMLSAYDADTNLWYHFHDGRLEPTTPRDAQEIRMGVRRCA